LLSNFAPVYFYIFFAVLNVKMVFLAEILHMYLRSYRGPKPGTDSLWKVSY